MADRGLESWTEGLSARERVREIAMTLTQPRSVEWVRDEAQVSSRQTVKDELEFLGEFGYVQAIERDDGDTEYAPNYQFRYFEEVTELIDEYTRDELREEIATLQKNIDEWKHEFNVESRRALELTLAEEDLSSEDVRDRNTVLRRWESHEENQRLLKHALELYDDSRPL